MEGLFYINLKEKYMPIFHFGKQSIFNIETMDHIIKETYRYGKSWHKIFHVFMFSLYKYETK